MPVFVGLDALDVGEVQTFVVQRDVRAVLGILVGRLTEPLAEHLRSHTVGYLALDLFGLGLVHRAHAIVRCAWTRR